MYDEGNEKEMVNEVSSQVSERKGGEHLCGFRQLWISYFNI